MKRLVIVLLSVMIMDILFQKCANPVNPTGGPKDTIPPILIKSTPSMGAINFSDQTITLEFNELINADKLKQNLIITPKSDINYKHIIKKNIVELKFEEPFQDSTTYSINFFDGITDITEKNPVENLYLAFSTGQFIDSMKVSGNVKNLFTQKESAGFTVGLYPITDTLDFLKDNPTYFTTTDEQGNFLLEYIKSGKYKITAFKDENRNLIFDPETEEHGFLSDTLNLKTIDTVLYSIRTQLINIKPIKYINSRPIGQYFEIKYSREVNTYNINPDTMYTSIIADKKDVIRLYNHNNSFKFNDSIQFIVTALDSLQNVSIDTIKAVFLDSNRKIPAFNSSFNTKPNSLLSNSQKIKLTFNKPIKLVDHTKIYFSKDSTFLYPISADLTWNHNKTELEIDTKINRDSIFINYERSLPLDTLNEDSTINNANPNLSENRLTTQVNHVLDFKIDKGAFISIENDSTEKQTLAFKSYDNAKYGSVNINLTTDKQSYTIQLLSSNGEVKYQMSNQLKASFPKVTPGNYKIRILIDTNNDGTWSNGNIIKNQMPEEVFIYPEETSIRENWVLDLEISF